MAEESKPDKLENGVNNGEEDCTDTEKSEPERLACRMKEMSEQLDNKIFKLPQTSVEIPGAKMIRKFEIGEPLDIYMQHKVLMVMGATGAGKSTLINGMINYILGVEWQDDFRFKLIALEDGKGIEHLDAIGFVTQSALVRLTPTQKYIFESILEMFGVNVKGNFLTLVTFCDGQKPPVIEAVQEEIPCSAYFKFNNSALYTHASDDDMFNQMFWKMGEMSFRTFFDEFNAKKSVSIMLTKKVLEYREELENLLSKVQDQVETCLNEMDVLRQEEMVLQKYQAQIEINKDFNYQIKVPSFKVIAVRSGTFATNCIRCNHTCHYPCEDDEQWKCKAMDSGGEKSARCKKCECSWQQHKKATERFEVMYKKETRSYDDLKRKFREAHKGQLTATKLIESHGSALEKAQTRLHMFVEEARTCMELLKQIALKPSSLTQADYIQLMINSEKSQRKPGWEERVVNLDKAKQQAAWRDNLVKYPGCSSIEEMIEKEKEKKEPGWEDRVKELEKMKRINTAVVENKIKRKTEFFSRVADGIRDISRGVKTIFHGK